MTPPPETSFPKHKIQVVLFEGVHEAARSAFEAEGFQVERSGSAADPASLVDAAREAHVIGIRSKTQLSDAVFRPDHRLLAVGCFCIGTNQVDLVAARQAGVPVFNSPFSNTRSVAELTLSEIIALHRRLMQRSAELHAGAWRKTAKGAHEVRGRTLGIVGYGRIGSQTSVLAEALGMRVIFHDVRPVLALGNATACASLDELLEQSDVVTLHVPATEQTRGMIGPPQLARMRPGSMLLNNARGSVVDLDALADTLRSGHLAGAAIDVYPTEPRSNDETFASPLRGLDNVILTPHIGGSTEEAQAAIGTDVSAKVLKFINNGSTTGAVNVPEVDLPSQEAPAGALEAPRAHRLLHFHRNRPGVLGRINECLSTAGANIAGQYLRTFEDVGYVVVDVEPTDTRATFEELRALEETIRVRQLW